MPIYAVALSSLTSSYSSVANNLRDFLHSQDSSSPAAWAFVRSDVEAVCLRHFYQVRGADRARGDADAERRKHQARSEFSFVKNQNNACELVQAQCHLAASKTYNCALLHPVQGSRR